jgi:hypothetical protein
VLGFVSAVHKFAASVADQIDREVAKFLAEDEQVSLFCDHCFGLGGKEVMIKGTNQIGGPVSGHQQRAARK